MNPRSNREFRKFLYAITVIGVVLSMGVGGTGLTTVQAKTSALAEPYWIYLPLVSTNYPPPSSQRLTVNKNGSGSGTVYSNPTGITCGATCSAAFDYATSVTLTADPNTDSKFTGWSGGGCSGYGTCTVIMDAAKSVTATFTSTTTYRLSIGIMGNGGSGKITSQPAGIDCHPISGTEYGPTCTYWFPYNTTVKLTATPIAPSTFIGWSGGVCSGTGICTVTMNGLKLVTANFQSSCSGLVNCDFESGSNAGWIESSLQNEPLIYDCSDSINCNYVTAYSGMYLAWLGGVDNEISSIKQVNVSIPVDASALSYWEWIVSTEPCDPNLNSDYAEVKINLDSVAKYELCTGSNTDGWVQRSIDIHAYAGQSVTLTISAITNASEISDFYLDYISIQTSQQAQESIANGTRNYPRAPTQGEPAVGKPAKKP